MGVRKIKKSYISCVGYFKSYKNNNQVAFESILERDFFTILEFEDDVLSYEEQPFRINYKLNGASTRYTPDVLVTYKNGSQKVFEVKYQNEIDSSEELQHKLSVLKDEIFEQKSLSFEIFTDINLNDKYLKTYTFLYRYAFLIENNEMTNKVLEAIKKYSSPVVVKALLESITMEPSEQLKVIPYIWKEVFKNRALINMNEKITMSSIIYPGGWDE